MPGTLIVGDFHPPTVFWREFPAFPLRSPRRASIAPCPSLRVFLRFSDSLGFFPVTLAIQSSNRTLVADVAAKSGCQGRYKIPHTEVGPPSFPPPDSSDMSSETAAAMKKRSSPASESPKRTSDDDHRSESVLGAVGSAVVLTGIREAS